MFSRTRRSPVTSRPVGLTVAASLAAMAMLTAAGCTSTSVDDADGRTALVTHEQEARVTVVGAATAPERAVEASRAMFASSPVAVVAPDGDEAGQAEAADEAERLGVPMLLAPAATSTRSPMDDTSTDGTSNGDSSTGPSVLAAELDRLGVETVLAVGDVGAVDGARVEVATSASSVDVPDAATPLDDVLAVVAGADDVAATATARAAGAEVQALPDGVVDLQASGEAIDALHASTTTDTVLIGSSFSTVRDPGWSVAAARSGAQLPGGGQRFFPDRRFVALYGAPGTGALGVLGEQDVAATVQRAADVAASYDAASDRPVVPMLEVIATVAAGAAGDDGDYSNELSVESIEPYVDAAAAAGQYVVIDLQPGRADFLSQAKRYESLLSRPNVGLALDPEWRLEADQVPLRQIGGVEAGEVNAVSTWLADLVASKGLPPKMFVLHQFRLDMLRDRASIDTTRPELATLIHADGQGSQPDKQATWRTLHDGAPAGVAWGWKNFYDEDAPMLSPEQTMADVSPTPDLVTYQ
ncbi:hypothetical protein [Frigoribacterium sp. MCBA15_019]|uniref:hypothetical protein n=1 Tax=Frigoribacterium sp. MCBA15_019 TaxID=1898745 RepID=UPI001C432E6F|nr:hypothetical protein [Frigoribacterium sp. MCBA15_019]